MINVSCIYNGQIWSSTGVNARTNTRFLFRHGFVLFLSAVGNNLLMDDLMLFFVYALKFQAQCKYN